MTPSQSEREYPALWGAVRELLPDLAEERQAAVVSLIVDTCPHCFENSRDCYCMCDD